MLTCKYDSSTVDIDNKVTNIISKEENTQIKITLTY